MLSNTDDVSGLSLTTTSTGWQGAAVIVAISMGAKGSASICAARWVIENLGLWVLPLAMSQSVIRFSKRPQTCWREYASLARLYSVNYREL